MAQLVDAQRKNDKALANYMGNAPETEGIKISPREWLGNLERRSSVFMILGLNQDSDWPDDDTRGEFLLASWWSVPEYMGWIECFSDYVWHSYWTRTTFVESLSEEDRELLRQTRENYMTPMERDWEDAKAVMKPYSEVDTKRLDLIKRDDPEGKDARVWSQWLTADEVQRDVLRRAYPTTIGDILQRVRSIRNLMLGGSKQLQKELAFWGLRQCP